MRAKTQPDLVADRLAEAVGARDLAGEVHDAAVHDDLAELVRAAAACAGWSSVRESPLTTKGRSSGRTMPILRASRSSACGRLQRGALRARSCAFSRSRRSTCGLLGLGVLPRRPPAAHGADVEVDEEQQDQQERDAPHAVPADAGSECSAITAALRRRDAGPSP